jgi:hypothetical protein
MHTRFKGQSRVTPGIVAKVRKLSKKQWKVLVRNDWPPEKKTRQLPPRGRKRVVEPENLQKPPDSAIPSQDAVPSRQLYASLVQVLTVRGHQIRPDFVVGRSLVYRAGRGLFCLSFKAVQPGEKLLPYWKPGARLFRARPVETGGGKYWLGDDVHGWINIEGAEDDGILSGMVNDNATFDHATCNCYVEWDEDDQMFWLKASQGWEAGHTVELYFFYGVTYWVWNAHVLTWEKRKRFHSMHQKAIQEVIDSQPVLYINPFTRRPLPKTGDRPRVTFGPTQTKTISDGPDRRGRPPKRPRDSGGRFL